MKRTFNKLPDGLTHKHGYVAEEVYRALQRRANRYKKALEEIRINSPAGMYGDPAKPCRCCVEMIRTAKQALEDNPVVSKMENTEE